MQENFDNTIQIIHKFSQPPSKLWQAWTDPSIVKKWFGSDPEGTVLEAQLDVRLGGSFKVHFANSNGSEFTAKGNYNVVELNKKLEFTWSWEDRPEVVEFVSVEFQPETDGTLMYFEHHNIDINSAHNYSEGWRSTFTKLEKAINKSS
ncbi:MAG: SRPBCC family protein [Anaerolineales bacterium]